jgi:hypothetical protein
MSQFLHPSWLSISGQSIEDHFCIICVHIKSFSWLLFAWVNTRRCQTVDNYSIFLLKNTKLLYEYDSYRAECYVLPKLFNSLPFRSYSAIVFVAEPDTLLWSIPNNSSWNLGNTLTVYQYSAWCTVYQVMPATIQIKVLAAQLTLVDTECKCPLLQVFVLARSLRYLMNVICFFFFPVYFCSYVQFYCSTCVM